MNVRGTPNLWRKFFCQSIAGIDQRDGQIVSARRECSMNHTCGIEHFAKFYCCSFASDSVKTLGTMHTAETLLVGMDKKWWRFESLDKGARARKTMLIRKLLENQTKYCVASKKKKKERKKVLFHCTAVRSWLKESGWCGYNREKPKVDWRKKANLTNYPIPSAEWYGQSVKCACLCFLNVSFVKPKTLTRSMLAAMCELLWATQFQQRQGT